jgi:hypothetical protein
MFNGNAAWRFTLLTGMIPAIPIALMLPFVSESQIWREKKQAGTLRRPSLSELFTGDLRRVTLVTAGLSACAYGVAFGALQLTPGRITPGLPDLAEHQATLGPLRKEAKQLNDQINALSPRLEESFAAVPGLREVAGQRMKVRMALRPAKKLADDPDAPAQAKENAQARVALLTKQLPELDAELDRLTAAKPEAKQLILDREKLLKQLGDNREAQEPAAKQIEAAGSRVQFYQELGGLAGRIALAALVIAAMPRRLLLRVFQVPGLIAIPLTYFVLFKQPSSVFAWGIAAVGFATVAQFSYLGEYLPKVFPLHLRGTGSSFATNVGGRMIGTSAAFVTTNLVAPYFAGDPQKVLPMHVAQAAGAVGLAIALIGLVLGLFLPEPKQEPVGE